jgi:hypothetical protein
VLARGRDAVHDGTQIQPSVLTTRSRSVPGDVSSPLRVAQAQDRVAGRLINSKVMGVDQVVGILRRAFSTAGRVTIRAMVRCRLASHIRNYEWLPWEAGRLERVSEKPGYGSATKVERPRLHGACAPAIPTCKLTISLRCLSLKRHEFVQYVTGPPDQVSSPVKAKKSRQARDSETAPRSVPWGQAALRLRRHNREQDDKQLRLLTWQSGD